MICDITTSFGANSGIEQNSERGTHLVVCTLVKLWTGKINVIDLRVSKCMY